MGYFRAITEECEILNEKAQHYLDQLPFMDNKSVIRRIMDIAYNIFEKHGKDWDAVPDWVATTIDHAVPYSCIPKNGSLHYALGYSVVSQDAHLRNLLEIAEGRETKELDFPVVVPNDFYDKK